MPGLFEDDAPLRARWGDQDGPANARLLCRNIFSQQGMECSIESAKSKRVVPKQSAGRVRLSHFGHGNLYTCPHSP